MPPCSECPPGGTAGLGGRDGVHLLGCELVDVPRRWAGTGCTVSMGETAVGNRRCPSALGEQLGQIHEARVLGHANCPALEGHVVAVDRDTDGTPGVALD